MWATRTLTGVDMKRSGFRILTLIFTLAFLESGFAQDDRIQIDSDSILLTQEIGEVQLDRAVLVNELSLSGEMGYYFSAVSPNHQSLINYLGSKSVQQQIELSKEQKSQFDAIRKKYSQGMAEISTKYSHRNDKKIAQELRNQFASKYKDELKSFKSEIEKEVQETLVPQQVKLIKQLQFNQSVKIWGFAHTVSKAPYSDQIKTTKKQSAEILKIKKDAEAEIRKAIEDIKAKAKAKMMKEFDRKQREKIKELEGESKKKKVSPKL